MDWRRFSSPLSSAESYIAENISFSNHRLSFRRLSVSVVANVAILQTPHLSQILFSAFLSSFATCPTRPGRPTNFPSSSSWSSPPPCSPLLLSPLSLPSPLHFSSMTLETVSETSNPPFSIFSPDAVLIFHRQAEISVVYQSYGGAQSETLPLSHQHSNHNEFLANINLVSKWSRISFHEIVLAFKLNHLIIHELSHIHIRKNLSHWKKKTHDLNFGNVNLKTCQFKIAKYPRHCNESSCILLTCYKKLSRNKGVWWRKMKVMMIRPVLLPPPHINSDPITKSTKSSQNIARLSAAAAALDEK